MIFEWRWIGFDDRVVGDIEPYEEREKARRDEDVYMQNQEISNEMGFNKMGLITTIQTVHRQSTNTPPKSP